MPTLRALILALIAVAPAAVAQPPARTPDALRTGEHQVVLNEVRFWYRVAGGERSSAPPLVFLHGGPGYSSHSFSVLEGPRLEGALRVVYYDQRGAGRSERPWTGHYQLDTLVEDVEALRRTLGVPQIAVMGHSFGGLLALEYAARYPEHVSRLVLVGAFSDGPATCTVHRDRLAAARPDAYARLLADTAWQHAPNRSDCDYELRALTQAEFEQYNTQGIFPDSALGKRQASIDSASGLRNTGEMGRSLVRNGLFTSRFSRGARLTMPTLVIAGARDYAIGVGPQRVLAASLPNARLLEYPGAGHFVYLDEPDRFTRDVLAFLGEPVPR